MQTRIKINTPYVEIYTKWRRTKATELLDMCRKLDGSRSLQIRDKNNNVRLIPRRLKQDCLFTIERKAPEKDD